MSANTYEIEVFKKAYNQPVDQKEIEVALGELFISWKPESNGVLVSPEDVGEAVEIINGLGYSTDEDESDDES